MSKRKPRIHLAGAQGSGKTRLATIMKDGAVLVDNQEEQPDFWPGDYILTIESLRQVGKEGEA
jgi:hypothetical protein